MNEYTRTDLACESAGKEDGRLAGCRCSEHRVCGYKVQRIKVETDAASKRLGKPCGTYLTVECGRINTHGEERLAILARLLAGELRGIAKRMTGRELGSDFGVFVAGLGNADLTADALGPETVARLTVTRHLREHEERLYRDLECCALSALAPGVLGQTGIETLEILRGAVQATSPDLVLVIDALAARDCDRLAATVQITDTGITPGSGVANHRVGIHPETVGVPVLAIGVPTVVDSSTLIYDALQRGGVEQIDEPLRRVLENGRSFFVSPKESDLVTSCAADLLARAIGLAFAGTLHGEGETAYF